MGEDVGAGTGGRPPGWYTDADKHGRERYWDGDGWTRRVRWPENPGLEQRLRMANAGELPDWYARPTLVAMIVVLAVAASIAIVWWAGLALVGWLGGMYLVFRYAPWLLLPFG